MPEPTGVPMVSPDGTVGTVPADQAGAAQAQGFTPMSGEEYQQEQLKGQYGGLGGMARAGLEGGARGLTFGLSDLAAAKLGGESVRKGMAARKELFPLTAGAGEVAGMVLPVLASGGAAAGAEGAAGAAEGASVLGTLGAIPRGVAAAGGLAEHATAGLVGEGATSLLGRVAQRAIPMAAGGAVEGAALGVGHQISEDALGGDEITAEKLLAAAGHGALAGGIAGGAIGAVAETGKYALEKAMSGSGSLRDSLKAFAEERTAKALGARGSDLKRLGSEAEMHTMARDVMDYRFADGTKLLKASDTTESLAPKVKAALEEQSGKLSKITDKLDEVVQAHPEVAPDMTKFFGELHAELKPTLESPLPSIRARAEKVLGEFADLRANAEAGVPLGFKEAREIRSRFDSLIYPAKGGPASEHAAELVQARRLFERTIEESADKAVNVSGDQALAGAYQEAKRTTKSLIEANRIAGRAELQDLGNRVISPTDYMSGSAGAIAGAASGHGGIGSALEGTMVGVAHKVIREHASSALAVGADALSNLGRVKAASNEVDARIIEGVNSFLKLGGHKATESALDDAVVAKAKAAATMGSLAVIGRTSHAEAAQQLQRVAELSNDPAKLLDHTQKVMGNSLSSVAPNVAAQVAMKEQARVAYLAKVAPQPTSPRSALTPQLDTVRYADGDINRWLRTKALVYNPTLLVTELNSGHVSPMDVQAVKATSPKLYEQILGHVTEKLADPKLKMSYSQRVQLGTLFGVAADETMKPEFQQFIGATYQSMDKGAGQQPGQAGTGGGQPKSRNVDIDLSPLETGMQRVEAKGAGT